MLFFNPGSSYVLIIHMMTTLLYVTKNNKYNIYSSVNICYILYHSNE